MVVPPLTMEDRSDDDFFDKLMDDEDDVVVGNGNGELSFSSNDEQVFENLSIDDVGSKIDGLDNVDRVEGDGSEKSGGNDVVSSDVSDSKGDDIGASVMGSQEGVDGKGSDVSVSGKSEFDSSICGNGLNISSGIEEEQGSGFTGSTSFTGGTRKPSFSNYFNQIGDDSSDPFAEVDSGSMVVSASLNGGFDHNVGRKSEFDSSIFGNGLNVSSGIEEMHGSAEFDSNICGNGLSVSSGSIPAPAENPLLPEREQGSGFSGVTQTASFSSYFDQIEGDSSDPFAEVGGSSIVASASLDSSVLSNDPICSTSSHGFGENGGDFQDGSSLESKNEVVDQNSIAYWESMYPGWKYDPSTGQWLQVNGNVQSTFDNPTSDVSYLHHTAQSAVSGSMLEQSTSTSTYWNQASYGNTEYPAHMVFDPNYPGWYYDTIAQEWRSLESYFQSINQSASLDQSQELPYQSANAANYNPEKNNMINGHGGQVNNHSYQLNQQVNWGGLGNEALNVTQIDKTTQYENGFTSNDAVRQYQNSFSYEQSTQSFGSGNEFNTFQSFSVDNARFHNFSSSGNTLQPHHHNKELNQQFSLSNFNSPNALNFSQQTYQNSGLSYSSSEGRSVDGRPPHALVSFGFGGKLVVMKRESSINAQPVYASQDSAGGAISILNLMELATPKNDGSNSNFGFSDCDYIRTLCQQSFPSPLVSGSVSNKELNKWIDDRIRNCDDIQDADYKKVEVLKMVLSLLKIACQFYGKLRSSFGADHSSKETDSPESALAKLFSSAKRNITQFNAVSQCLQNMPSEAQVQATAKDVQMLLVSGKKMEALQCAQQGHLWGLAIVIATLLGDQFYGETVKQMALHQMIAGSPLRTLCLLIAGQPAEVFSNSIAQSGVNIAQTSMVGPGFMLDDWEENLAIMSANRTNGDELVITHLGDCLWKEKGEVMSAHICYLVAEASIESYSESARLCLVGADHLKYPRTYASPQAIQRTELYEYSKVLGNSQFVLLPFQPYKLIYASMLAEVGKLSDSLKYCQAVLKSLKTGRSPEVETWRHMISSLEERIKIHQQSGFGTNLGRAELVGKLLNFFDNTAHRVVGGLPPPAPSTSHSNGQHSELDHQARGQRVSTSQSTMAMSSLMTSASAVGNNLKTPDRSMSEPNIGRTPKKEESPKSSSSSPLGNTSTSGSSSRLGRFGSQIFQKTVGLVLKARPDRQAKLGETNKFYYDEKLKRWVEEGAESQVEEMTLAPPPTTASFINGNLNHDKKDESTNSMVYGNGESEFKDINLNGKGPELPPMPSAPNQFSARGRMGVRSRYVDTFNKGGGNQLNSFQSPTPPISTMNPTASNPKFFIPTPVSESAPSPQQNIITDDDSASLKGHDSFSSPQMLTPVSTIQRHPSMDKGMDMMKNSNESVPPNSRRTLSWGGNLDFPNHNITNTGEIRSPGQAPSFQ